MDEYFVHIHGCPSQVFVPSHKYPVIKNIYKINKSGCHCPCIGDRRILFAEKSSDTQHST